MATMVDPLTGEPFLYITRADWGAAAPRRRLALASSSQGLKDHWVVAYPPGTVDQVCALARSIQRMHKDGHGWFDYAYNFSYGTLADGRGYIVEGRGFGIANGAQGGGAHCHAISWYGGLPYPPDTQQPNDAGYRARLAVERNIAGRGFNTSPNTCHKDESATACPGAGACAWVKGGKPVGGGPPATGPAPTPPPPSGIEDNRTYWRPPATRNLRRTTPMQSGNDAAEFQFLGNLTVADPNTSGTSKWTEVDGHYGDDSARLCRLIQTYGEALNLYGGAIDGIAGAGTGHIVVHVLNSKNVW